MKNMVEVVLDDEKIEREGRYDVENLHFIVDNLFVDQAGMAKEGNFYIDDHPQDDYGIGMSCILFLAGKQWFRDNVKEMRWYRDVSHLGNGYEYHVEDVVTGLLDGWEESRRRDGLPINR